MTPSDVSDEVRNTLAELRAQGYKTAIGSSSKNAKYILGNIGLNNAFDAISDGTDITRSKPDPEVFLKAASYLGEDPFSCAIVEDAKAGIDAAKEGGFLAIGIYEASEYECADITISSFHELLSLI